MQRSSAMLAGIVATLTIAIAPAAAGTFDVKGVEVTKGESELSFDTAWQRGFPVNSDFVRQSHETSYSYGITTWFKLGAKIGFEQPDGEKLDASYAVVEAQAVLINPSPTRIGVAWFTGFEVGLKQDASESLTFGPLLALSLSKDTTLLLNPLFQKSWDPSTPGVDFNYAWQVKRTINDNVAIGLEGYGVIPDIGNAPSADFQEHRLGPVLFLSHETGGGDRGGSMKLGSKAEPDKGGGKVELQVGVLFGFTDATPDTTGRAKLAFTW
ncbi:MAG TPA: hypothetical protein VFV47_11435 [Hyphomicrobiaceae bacterium]|nr:hypothetical protein [Hyphomicrobiaceae bacterium]